MSLRRSVYSGARAFFSEIAQGTSAKTVWAIRQARSDAVQVAEKCSRRGGDTHSSVYQFQSCRQYCRRSGPEFQNRSPVWLISAPCPTTYLLHRRLCISDFTHHGGGQFNRDRAALIKHKFARHAI